MLEHFKNFLFIGPHPDDVELGCGGTISRLTNITNPPYISYIIVSPATEDPRNKNILMELHNSCTALNIPNPIVLNYLRRIFHEKLSDIRQELYDLITNSLKPDIIFTTCPFDLHQDHSIVGAEVVRLFRDTTIIGYEVINSNIGFYPTLFVELTTEDLNRKAEALLSYKSQSGRPYFNREAAFSLARSRGIQVNKQYAEAFQVLKMVV